MRKIEIGESVTIQGKTYKITGTHKRSFILEHEGKQYKATQEKIEKALEQAERQATAPKSYLEMKIAQRRIWDKTAKMPENEEEAMVLFVQLAGDLSPENLSCDGELSRAEVARKLKYIHGAWRELEELIGRSMSEDEVYKWEGKRRSELYKDS